MAEKDLLNNGSMEPTQHLQWSKVRQMGGKQLREQKEIVQIFSRSEPIAILIPYERFLRIREVFLDAAKLAKKFAL